jgi:hypothetical protein
MTRLSSNICVAAMAITIAAGFALPASAEVYYTPVVVSIPAGGYYNIDLNHDGIADFTLRSALLQDYCQFGDGYLWSLTVSPSTGNAVMTPAGRIGSANAAALAGGVPVNSWGSFYPGLSTMAELYWGSCGVGAQGQWLNIPNRYLGLKFLGPDNQIHYGWANVSTIAYVDQHGHFQNSTILSGFAYETIPGQQISTGQISDTR